MISKCGITCFYLVQKFHGMVLKTWSNTTLLLIQYNFTAMTHKNISLRARACKGDLRCGG